MHPCMLNITSAKLYYFGFSFLLYGANLLFVRTLTHGLELLLEIFSFHDLFIPTMEVPE